jgi:hypothetical protein
VKCNIQYYYSDIQIFSLSLNRALKVLHFKTLFYFGLRFKTSITQTILLKNLKWYITKPVSDYILVGEHRDTKAVPRSCCSLETKSLPNRIN